MERKYAQLTIEERCEIARLRASGVSIRQIAAALDRSPSTIAREMKRNCSQNGQYRPGYADQQSRARRWTGSKLDRNPDLRQPVLSRLTQGWSPEQVAGRLYSSKREQGLILLPLSCT
jgi:IS30 family transposase